MKWVTFISLIFLISSVHSREIVRRDAHKSEIAKRYRDLGEVNVKGLVLITFAQFLQKCPYEDHIKLVNEVVEFAKGCAADETAENCDKSLHQLFGDKLCSLPNFQERYGEMTECCAKEEPERNQCFLSHKDDHPDLPRYEVPDADTLCHNFQENENRVLGKYLYEVARRHPYFYAPALLFFAFKYKDTVGECCQSADKAACSKEKLSTLRDKALAANARQRYRCSSLDKFGERAVKAGLVARLSQKFPKIEFGELHKIVEDLTKGYKECCHGDLLECADDRVALSEYVCKHKDTISSKLGKCCDKPVIQKSQCIADLENDDIPADLPNFLAEYVETKDACKNYQEANEVYLAHYLYDSGRRHPELAVTTLLRLAKDYEHTLEKCCATADPPACYAKVADDRKAVIEEADHLIKENCDIFEKLGEYGFENALLVRYTRKAPQVSTPTLLNLAHRLASVGSKCCKVSDQEKMECTESHLAFVIDKLCRLHEKTPVSERLTKCCTDSLVNRRSCFTALGVDEAYEPKAFSADTFTFHADLCTLPLEEKQNKKQSVLVELIKHKPKITDEQLKTVATDFTEFVDKCCKEADQEACFAADGPKLVASAQAALA
ncbi:albumin-like [Phascolarctos cinereus]|uniref:Albumin n=1 Tax=Phascolarctos cinereus TaxID=38626 RepID=A0A6P5KHQ0_PHACI|nr:serum albumin-like [Phascolarctos cinereus]